MSKKKHYEIQATQQVTYWKSVQLTDEEYQELKKCEGSGSIHQRSYQNAAYNILDSFFTPNDITDAEPTYSDFTIKKFS